MSKENSSESTCRKVYGIKEVAVILGINQKKAKALMSTTSEFPGYKIGSQLFVRKEDFEKWFDDLAGKEIKINWRNDDTEKTENAESTENE